MVCLFAASGLTAEVSDQKPQTAASATAKTQKDTSLYLYYQQHLKPYFANPPARTEDRYKEPGQKAAPSQAAPTGSLVLGRSKTGDAGADKDKEASRETTYVTLNRLDSVGLEAINKTFPKDFRKEYIAELALGIKLSPLLDLTFGKVQKFERSEGTPWETRDDGWRIRLKKDF